MPSTCTLDKNILEYLLIIRDSINNRKYWTSFNYTYTYDKLSGILACIRSKYITIASQTLEESSRQLLDGTFSGDFQVYVDYYNALIYVRKLEYKVRWHEKYHAFPK